MKNLKNEVERLKIEYNKYQIENEELKKDNKKKENKIISLSREKDLNKSFDNILIFI